MMDFGALNYLSNCFGGSSESPPNIHEIEPLAPAAPDQAALNLAEESFPTISEIISFLNIENHNAEGLIERVKEFGDKTGVCAVITLRRIHSMERAIQNTFDENSLSKAIIELKDIIMIRANKPNLPFYKSLIWAVNLQPPKKEMKDLRNEVNYISLSILKRFTYLAKSRFNKIPNDTMFVIVNGNLGVLGVASIGMVVCAILNNANSYAFDIFEGGAILSSGLIAGCVLGLGRLAICGEMEFCKKPDNMQS